MDRDDYQGDQTISDIGAPEALRRKERNTYVCG
jgi:hypothetical protein